MDEKDFLEFLISERMGMHHDNFVKECPPTGEEAAEIEKAGQAHELLYGQLTKEQRELLEQYEDGENTKIVRKFEYYYRVGFKDGIKLDKLIKQFKGEK